LKNTKQSQAKTQFKSGVFGKNNELLPLDCLDINGNLLFCFQDHGILYNPETQKKLSTLVWMDQGQYFGLYFLFELYSEQI